VQRHHIAGTPSVEFSDEEYAAVVAVARKTLNEGRFAMSPRLDPLKAALANLDPASLRGVSATQS
jgi:hypothetical protein